MGMMQVIGAGSDRVMATLVAGLETQFGKGAGQALAQRLLEAEESDLLWSMRETERWLGAWAAIDHRDIQLDRVAIMGRCDRDWFVAVMLVDGEGDAHGVIGRRNFERKGEAHQALALAR